MIKLFQDATGKYVIAQPPNIPVYLMLFGVIGSRAVASGPTHDAFELLFFGAAFLWSYLEIRFGESGFRRILGAVVMGAIFASKLLG